MPTGTGVVVMDVTDATFAAEVIERSFEVPVVVDFWAEWCGPCRALSPVLERLASEGAGAWVLAKIDVDENPQVAAEFGVQGIPAVRAIRDGRQVAEFVGALPEAQVREWLEQLGPTPADIAFERGEEAERRGQMEAAAEAYGKCLDLDPGHKEAKSSLERMRLLLRAEGLDEQELRDHLQSDPRDLDALMGLADIEAATGNLKGASDRLIEIVKSSRGEEREQARRHLLKLLDTVAADDPRAVAARRALSLALF